MYGQGGPQAGAQGFQGAQGAQQEGPKADDIQDADFEEVK
jgi:molecular chaperone DnaK